MLYDPAYNRESVTVIIPTKNRPEGIRAAVASALVALPAEDSSLIVIDDASNMPVKDVLDFIEDPRLSVILNTGKNGPAAARNLGARLAQGNILFFLDDDDVILPDYIRQVVTARQQGARAAGFGFSTAISGKRIKGKQKQHGLLEPYVPLAARLTGLGMGFWIAKSTFTAVGGIDESLQVNEDTDFCLKLATNSATAWFSLVPGVELNPGLAKADQEAASTTSTASAELRAQAFETILARHAGLLSSNRSLRHNFIRRLIKYRSRMMDAKGAIAAAYQEPNTIWRSSLLIEAIFRNIIALHFFNRQRR